MWFVKRGFVILLLFLTSCAISIPLSYRIPKDSVYFGPVELEIILYQGSRYISKPEGIEYYKRSLLSRHTLAVRNEEGKYVFYKCIDGKWKKVASGKPYFVIPKSWTKTFLLVLLPTGLALISEYGAVGAGISAFLVFFYTLVEWGFLRIEGLGKQFKGELYPKMLFKDFNIDSSADSKAIMLVNMLKEDDEWHSLGSVKILYDSDLTKRLPNLLYLVTPCGDPRITLPPSRKTIHENSED